MDRTLPRQGSFSMSPLGTAGGLTCPERPFYYKHAYEISIDKRRVMDEDLTEANTPTLGFLLHDVARLLKKRFEQNARGSGLTRSQWQVLAYLARNEGINQTGLAELLDIEPITLSRIVDKLEAMGLVARFPHPTDRRVWVLNLTASARPKLDQVRELGDATRGEALVGVPEKERQALVKTLTALKKNLTAACDTPAVQPKRPVRS